MNKNIKNVTVEKISGDRTTSVTFPKDTPQEVIATGIEDLSNYLSSQECREEYAVAKALLDTRLKNCAEHSPSSLEETDPIMAEFPALGKVNPESSELPVNPQFQQVLQDLIGKKESGTTAATWANPYVRSALSKRVWALIPEKEMGQLYSVPTLFKIWMKVFKLKVKVTRATPELVNFWLSSSLSEIVLFADNLAFLLSGDPDASRGVSNTPDISLYRISRSNGAVIFRVMPTPMEKEDMMIQYAWFAKPRKSVFVKYFRKLRTFGKATVNSLRDIFRK